jgi:electron transfer flavoprotein alpha subunit
MILIYSDNKKTGLELAGKAKDLAKELSTQVVAALIGTADEKEAQELIQYGADKVIMAETTLQNFKPEEYTDILEKIALENNCDTILIGSTKNGKELAPRLAAKLNAGSATDCNALYLKDGKLTVERVVFSGNAIAVQQFTSSPRIVTVPPKAFDIPAKDESRKGEINKAKYEAGAYGSKILKVQEMSSDAVNVEEATIIVSCGRGLKKKEDIKLLEELAEVLKATVGCSRPIAADLKWLSVDHWIGLSGHKVKPRLYIACGISGQVQHIAGMRDSGIIVAVNKDPEAPIFKSADYGIVGDLYAVLPALTNAMRVVIKS